MEEVTMCYLFVPTILKLIQAARTKGFFTSRNRRCRNQHVSHVCGWNERELTNTNHG